MSKHADRDLSQLYRAGAREEPPSWLDDTILTAGRDAVRGAASPTERRQARWQVPFALAAVLILAVSLTLVMRDELEQNPATSSDTPPPGSQELPAAPPGPEQSSGESRQLSDKRAPDHRAPQAKTPAASVSPRAEQERDSAHRFEHERSRSYRSDSPAGAPTAAERQRKEEAAGTPVQSAAPVSPSLGPSRATASSPVSPSPAPSLPTPPSPASPSPASPKQIPGEQPAGRMILPGTGSVADTTREAASASPAPQLKAAEPQRAKQSNEHADAHMTPQQWLHEIEQLRREGREEQARARLQQFRKRFPDYPLPHSLQ